MAGFERGLADVFSSLEAWLVSSGATGSVLQLSWAVLTVLWLGHVAATTRPGGAPDLVATFGRLAVAGGLLSAVGSVNQIILRAFETLRDAGSAILSGLVGQNWNDFVSQWLTPEAGTLLQALAPWFSHPWAIAVFVGGALLGVLLFAIGFMVYLAILFFAHLTLLLAMFLAPLAMALLAAPGTTRWTGRWALVIVRTALVVFSVRVIHAAAIYLAVIFPIRQIAGGVGTGFSNLGVPGGPGSDPMAFLSMVAKMIGLVLLMLVGTGMGVYAMLRSERLTGQFVEGVAFGEGLFAGPVRLRGWMAGRAERSAQEGALASAVGAMNVPGADTLWSGSGGAQQATVVPAGGRGLS